MPVPTSKTRIISQKLQQASIDTKKNLQPPVLIKKKSLCMVFDVKFSGLSYDRISVCSECIF